MPITHVRSGQQRRNTNCLIVKEGRFGLGVFTDRDVSEGDIVLTFSGSLITFGEAVEKGAHESYALQISDKLYLDTEEPGCLVNHSCDPNTGVRSEVGEYALVAIRTIRAGEEILYDYSTTMAENYWEMHECRCGAATCRNDIRDFKHLDAMTQRRYLALGIVEEFIAAKFKRVIRRPTDVGLEDR
jgi:SET domain-containing protein